LTHAATNTLGRLHFVGIGGIGMAALAELFHARGHAVSGSDLVAGATFLRLGELGVDVQLGQGDIDLTGVERVVRSSAIADDNPEIVAAKAHGVPIISRGGLLAEVMAGKESIAIAGSHGKTTTSAMTAHAFDVAGLDPTALIGGRVPRAQGGASPVRLGESDLLVAEVDESDGSFLLTRPRLAAITNADPEHLDHYGTREVLLDAFVSFANRIPEDGICALGIDHPGVREIDARITAPKIRFGFDESADLRATRVEAIPGGQRCHITLPDGRSASFDLPMPGRHNILNALAAIALGLSQGIDVSILTKSFATFPGVSRRFERKGQVGSMLIVDDYAHHPAELRATLEGARSVHEGPITALFQPHRFTRTRDCWDDFLGAFANADRVIITEIYAASEEPIEGISGEALARAIGDGGHPDVHFGGSLDSILDAWPARLRENELLMTLGAGDVVSLGPRLLSALETQANAEGNR